MREAVAREPDISYKPVAADHPGAAIILDGF